MNNIVQTFYVDPAALGGADTTSITSVDLFFKAKPNAVTNETGITNPGITVGICRFDQNTTDVVLLGSSRMPYNGIYDSSDGTAVTTFTFGQPVIVDTAKTYGVVVLPEDGGYDIWVAKAGDRSLGTNLATAGATSNRQGRFFSFTGTTVSNEQTATSLKMIVKVAKYTSTTLVADLVNEPYEFLSVSSRINTFTGGEYVFANTVLLTGNVAVSANSNVVVGTGTSFMSLTTGQSIVITSGAVSAIVNPISIVNATSMIVSPPLPFTNTVARYRNGIVGIVTKDDVISNKVILNQSNANSTAYFAAGQLITGAASQASAVITSVDDLAVDKFVTHIDASTSTHGSISASYTLAYANGANFVVANTFTPLPNSQTVVPPSPPRFIVSRSHEVQQSYLFSDDARSAVAEITVNSSSPYAAPVLNDGNTDMVVYKNQISNVYQRQYSNGVYYDSEITFNGAAISKHITKKMTFDNNVKAEDLIVYVSAFKPANTDIRVYARIYNSDDEQPFDDKLWTKLTCTLNANVISSVDSHNYVEYQYSIPNYHKSSLTADDKFVTTANSAVIAAVSTAPNATFSSGQVVKVYNELFPSNYIIGIVSSANTTTLTLTQPINTAGVTGTGQKIDVIEFGQQAFKNMANFGVVRYFNSDQGVFDTFNTVQVKVVFLSDTTSIVPEIDQIEVIGVSA